MTPSLEQLALRVEAATAESAAREELGVQINEALGIASYITDDGDPTQSLDAAMTLIDGDTFFHLSRFDQEAEGRSQAHVYPNRHVGDDYEAEAATPALALCAAALRAISATRGSNNG